MSDFKETMKINEEFLHLFDEQKKKLSKKKTSKKKGKKDINIKSNTLQENFKDNIIVFIEPYELYDIQNLLKRVDKIKRKKYNNI